MKKIISLVLALMLCVALAVPAMAAPSVTYEAVSKEILVDSAFNGEEVSSKLVVTTELGAANSDVVCPEYLEVLEQIKSGAMVLPLEEGFELRDVVCVDFIDEEMAEALKEEGVTVTVTFDLGVAAEAEVVAFSFVDGEWIEAVSVVNNGDGSVTVVFEDICPVVFAVKE